MAKYGYLGNNPDNSRVLIAREYYIATGVQTNFTFLAGYTPGYIDVYFNGAKLIDAQDYTATNGSTVGLTSAATASDTVELIAYKAFSVGTRPTLGISSAGETIANTDITSLNFIGAGNTFLQRGNVVDIAISGGGAIGISSNNLATQVGQGVTHLNFVGAAITQSGLTTSIITINKTFTIGLRTGTANLNVTSGIATISLRTSTDPSGVGTIRF